MRRHLSWHSLCRTSKCFAHLFLICSVACCTTAHTACLNLLQDFNAAVPLHAPRCLDPGHGTPSQTGTEKRWVHYLLVLYTLQLGTTLRSWLEVALQHVTWSGSGVCLALRCFLTTQLSSSMHQLCSSGPLSPIPAGAMSSKDGQQSWHQWWSCTDNLPSHVPTLWARWKVVFVWHTCICVYCVYVCVCARSIIKRPTAGQLQKGCTT